MRSKTHATLTAPLVLHRTMIDKCAMKKFGFNGQLRNKLFLIVIHRFSLVKAAVNALHICKMRNGVNKTPQFLNPSAQCCCTIANLKTRRCSNTVKGSQRMVGGRIFLKNLRNTTCAAEASFWATQLKEAITRRLHLHQKKLCVKRRI